MLFKGEEQLKTRFDGWYPMCSVRYSTREYQAMPITHPDRESVLAICDVINGFGDDVRMAAVFDAKPNAFSSLIFTNLYNVPAFVAVMMDKSSDAYEKAGYYGEAVCLELTRLGLKTCWVSGSIKRSQLDEYLEIGSNERFITCIAFGYGLVKTQAEEAAKRASRSRKELDKIVTYDTLTDDWRNVMICAQLAPSAINRQPWHYQIDNRKLYVQTPAVKGGPFPVPLDIGISMLHVSAAAHVNHIGGTWEAADRYLGVFE